jgi:hypothetical protein
MVFKVMVLVDFTILKIIILRKFFGNFSKINEMETFNCGIVFYFFEASPWPWLWLLRLKLLNDFTRNLAGLKLCVGNPAMGNSSNTLVKSFCSVNS